MSHSSSRNQGPPTPGVYAEEPPARPPRELLGGAADGPVVASPAPIDSADAKPARDFFAAQPNGSGSKPERADAPNGSKDARSSTSDGKAGAGSSDHAAAAAAAAPAVNGTASQRQGPSRLANGKEAATAATSRNGSISMMADGIGGAGLGTAATGDLGARSEFETLDDIRRSVKELEEDFDAKHPDMPLSGRIIHVSHYIPFVIRPLAEMEFERQREERIAATASVAAMAAAARAKKAAKLAAEAERRELEAQRELQRQASQFSARYYSWEAYYAANEAFAKRVAAEYRPGDLVWVHDYHLLLVPLMLRKLVPDAHIGLFVHAPFPSSEVFRCLPKRKEILEGMLGADLACFQAFSYSRHFLSSCIRVLGSEASSNSVESDNGGHVTNITYNPIGIDSAKIAKDSSSEGVLPKIQAIREMYKGKKILIGRDKLDVVRGVVQKLQAFHKFLAEFPEWRNKVVLIQVTAPALNDSPKLERQVSELVSHINGEFGSLSFTPVHHYHQIIDRDEYFALLSVADLALITSVRDGMNTTSMEYIICQERFAKSPLILSEFTGTAGRMRSAIQVNPWNIFGVAKAIDYALRLTDDEKRARHDQLYHQVVSHTSHTWAAGLVKQLLVRLISEHSAHFTPPLDRDEMLAKFGRARKRLFMLDYDGTLTPIVKQPEMAVPSQRLLDALKVLAEDPRNVIFIISGRDGAFLGKHLGHFRNIGFSAEHGGFLKLPGSDEWRNLTEELDMSWMKGIRGVFEYYTERTGGSFIEQKKSSITWHYRGADPDFGSFQAKECQAHLENLTSHNKLPVEVLVGKKNLEVRPLAVNKGEIVKRLLYDHPDADFVFCAGDDKTDEDMFRTLYNLAPANSSDSAGGGAGAGAGRGASLSPLQTAAAHKVDVNVACRDVPKDAPLVISPPAPLKQGMPVGEAKTLELVRDAIYTTVIGPNNRKTLAEWHVDNVDKIIASLSEMAGLSTPAQDPPSVEADEPQP
ncbi:uncharacterized protein PFL1_05538 [Pseudozyma flocculosa PF-1]|uniref:Uncharacterized protein n=1 Tax=Pseudozyma flocculosa PF-1 TaxID=1277687 RepID=A0A061H347_9BASI|nr:uncharacterized protein PFL1_05538 [Pseudozyma flocculosa PF-1]EPQ26903.1 hypothetical protein PFL1_05538 [Pseudozyma flocculosa PF-1]